LCGRLEGDILSGMERGGENEVRTVWWEADAVCLIDQTRLPHARATVRCGSVAEVAAAIREMVVRGAPAIGVTAAYGMALAARKSAATDRIGLLDELAGSKKTLDTARPTAVNLKWATDRMLRVARERSPHVPVPEIAERLLAEAHEIRDEDERMCRRIGEHGAALLGNCAQVLTHCNAGGLPRRATAQRSRRSGRRMRVARTCTCSWMRHGLSCRALASQRGSSGRPASP
jgi:methylthioribose-1-phosphate isomerase